MKKLILASVLIFTLSVTLYSQTVGNAIGARIGAGAEVSYQYVLTDVNRLEFDLGLSGWETGGFQLSGLYHWVFTLQDRLNWYIGPGVQIGQLSYKTSNNSWENKFGIGAAGQIGIEYNFEIPLQLSLDWKPSFPVFPSGGSFGYQGIALGVRYVF